MRFFSLLFTITTLSLTGIGITFGANAPISCRLVPDNNIKKLGEDISEWIEVQNISQGTIATQKLHGGDATGLYQETLKFEDGRSVDYRQSDKDGNPILLMGSTMEVNLNPGDILTDKLPLSYPYQIDRPGRYIITVQRSLSKNEGGGTLSCGSLSFVVEK